MGKALHQHGLGEYGTGKPANWSDPVRTLSIRGIFAGDNVGHSTVGVTQNIYTSTWWEQRKAAVEGIGNLIWGDEPKH